MKVKIDKVINEDSKNAVIFTTEYGSAKATWNGELPEINKDYFVEFEIPNILIWGKDVITSQRLENAIGMESGIFYMVGFLESVEEDGYIVVRIGENIISLVVEGKPLKRGSFVKVKSDSLFLYNMNY